MRILSTIGMKAGERELLASVYPDWSFRHEAWLHPDMQDFLSCAEVWVTYGGDVTPEALERMPSLRWIHVMQSGVNGLPFEELAARGVAVTNARGINAVPIAEFVMGTMLNIVRRTFVFYEAQRRREWDERTRLEELAGKTLGILGLGRIGRELAKRAKAFDMRVVAVKRSVNGEEPYVDALYRSEEKLRLLSESDFVAVLLPLTPHTRGYIGEEEIAAMRPNAHLIHISRGEVLDQQALLRALRAGTIGGAALDVFPQEPLPAEDPYWIQSNVWVTPHIAGDHFPAYMPRAMQLLMDNMDRYKDRPGELLNRIDLASRY